MTSGFKLRKLTARELRFLVMLAFLIGIAAWKFIPRPWKPTVVIETAHYTISSTATREQTEEIGRVVEMLYSTYSNRFGTLPGFQSSHPRLKLLLYKDRDEMRRINPGLGWAEAFYRKPYCRAYYSAKEINPYHWMLHEAVHQLNTEVAQLNLEKWLEEGLAEYFSTSRIRDGQIVLGSIDKNTYPIWWMDEIATSPELDGNLENGSVISLRSIITDRGGPSMRKHFNLYYLHWWTLTHFVFENRKHEKATAALLQRGGNLQAFEELIGTIAQSQEEWHSYVKHIKNTLDGNDISFGKTGRLPPMTNEVQRIP